MSDRRNVVILDGGMGKELLRIGAPFRQPEWSALALLEAPEFVLEAHRNFIEAGAQVIITNTYSVCPHHLGEERFHERGYELAETAARLARQAADEAPHAVRVAGSLPPQFGSYSPQTFRPEEARAHWSTLIEAQAPFVDFWLGETISSIAEAEGIMDAIESGGGPDEFWMSFCLNNESTAEASSLVSGDQLSAVVDVVTGHGVRTISFNCCKPELIAAALRQTRTLLGDNPAGITTGAYANAFVPGETGYASNDVILDHREDLDAKTYADFCVEWAGAGATAIGGCCGIYPEHIAEVAKALR